MSISVVPYPPQQREWIDFDEACKEAKSLFNALGLGRKVFDEHKYLFAGSIKGKEITHPDVTDAYLSMEQSMEEQWHWVHRELGLTRVFSDAQVKEQAERDAWFWFKKMFPRQHSKYTPKMAQKGRQTQSDRADEGAAKAKAMNVLGYSLDDIADAVKKSVKTVRRWIKRTVSQSLITKALSFFSDRDIRNSSLSLPSFNLLEKEREITRVLGHSTVTDVPASEDDNDLDEVDVIAELKKHWEVAS